jgi:hypothetical protein
VVDNEIFDGGLVFKKLCAGTPLTYLFFILSPLDHAYCKGKTS